MRLCVNNSYAYVLEGVCKRFDRTEVLSNVDLCIHSGDLIAITGTSGSGKSTLLNQLSGLDQPTSGNVKLLGKHFSSLSVDERANIRNSNIGIIFQQYYLVPYLTILENVLLPIKYKAVKNEDRVKSLFDEFNMTDTLNKYPYQLSGGQQQRICIIRALANEPNIIIADEPTAALDDSNSNLVFDMLKKLNEKGHTVIIVTHNNSLARRCNRSIILKDGRLIGDNLFHLSLDTTLHFNNPKNKTCWDSITTAIDMAKTTLKRKKLQTFLSTLAIAVGIFSLILVDSLGRGAKQEILDELSHLKNDRISINSYLSPTSIDGLTVHDLSKIKSEFNLKQITPYLSKRTKVKEFNVDVIGVSQSYFDLMDFELLEGRNLSVFNIINGEQVTVINKSLSNKLIKPTQDSVLNGYLRLDSGVYKIIGIANDVPGYENYYSHIPHTTFKKYIGDMKSYEKIIFSLPSHLSIDIAVKALKKMFSNRNSIVIESDLETERILLSTSIMLHYLILSVSGTTLLVGSIGIMNITLCSFRERINEIGVRSALGAKPLDIKLQFLSESILTCISGGVLGCVFYILSYVMISVFFDSFSLFFSLSTLSFSLIFSGLIGVILGYVPARKATKLNPLECLNL